MGFLLLAVACQAEGDFKPQQGARTPSGPLVNNASLVSFADLDADPAVYLNQLIRVTGELLLLEEEVCPRWRGPRPVWALVDQVGDEVMRLDAVGYEDLVRRVPEGTVLTVDGFWRLYEGPLGCGKEPPDGLTWYLEVIRLVQPNPLPLTSGGGPTSPRVTLPAGEPVEAITPSPEGTLPPSPTPSRTPTRTPTLGAGTVTPTLTPSTTPPATVSPTPTSSSTPGGPTVTPSQTPTAGPAATRPGASTATPGAATPTPSGYPVPTVNPNPSPTSSGYP